MLGFGYIVDRFGRKWGMQLATIIVFVFSALAAGAKGAGGSTSGLFQALIAYRFLTGYVQAFVSASLMANLSTSQYRNRR